MDDLIPTFSKEDCFSFAKKKKKTFGNAFEEEVCEPGAILNSSKAFFSPRFRYDLCVVMSNGIV